jgi:hypothetical protein
MKRLLLLCAALVLAQLALAAHGIDHGLHAEEVACVECLALPGMQAVPASPSSVPAPVAAVAPTIFAVPPAPTFGRLPAFRSRAPPVFQSV